MTGVEGKNEDEDEDEDTLARAVELITLTEVLSLFLTLADLYSRYSLLRVFESGHSSHPNNSAT